MTPEQLEALRNGASMEEVLAMAVTTDTEAQAAAAAAASVAAAAQTTEAADGDTVTVEALQATVAQMTTAAEANATALAAKDQEITALSTKLKELEAQASASDATVKTLTAAMTPYVLRMGVALNKPQSTDKMSASELVAAHTALAADFSKAFPSGRKSNQTATKADDAAKAHEVAAMSAAKSLKF